MHVHGGCVCGAKGNPGVMWLGLYLTVWHSKALECYLVFLEP